MNKKICLSLSLSIVLLTSSQVGAQANSKIVKPNILSGSNLSPNTTNYKNSLKNPNNFNLNTNLNSPSIRSSELHAIACEQTGDINALIDAVSMAINKDKLRIVNKDIAKEIISNLRNILELEKTLNNDEKNIESTYKITIINKDILRNLFKACQTKFSEQTARAIEVHTACYRSIFKNFEQFDNFIQNNIQDPSKNLQASDLASSLIEENLELRDLEIRKKLISNDITINFILKNIKILSSNGLQKALYNLEEFDKEYKLSKLGLRLLPYAGLLVYYTLFTNEYALPNFEPLQKLKRFLGHPAKKVEIKEPKANSRLIKSGERIIKTQLVGSANVSSELPKLPIKDLVTSLREELGKNIPDSDKLRLVNNLLENTRNQNYSTQNVKYEDFRAATQTRETYLPGTGHIGSLLGTVSKLITVKQDSLFTLAPIALLSPIIKNDIQDLYSWSSKKIKRLYAALKGEEFVENKNIRVAKNRFSDLYGFEDSKAELSPILRYYSKKALFDLAGLQVNRGYILTGPQDISRSLIESLGGEISNLVKQDCLIYEIDAHELVNKDLSNITSNLSDKFINLIFIKNIEALNSIKADSKDPKAWSKLLVTLSDLLNSDDIDVLIFGSTKDASLVNCEINERLSKVITVSKPNLKERYLYLENNLKEFPQIDQNQINSLAKKTDNYSFENIDKIIDIALQDALFESCSLDVSYLNNAISRVKVS